MKMSFNPLFIILVIGLLIYLNAASLGSIVSLDPKYPCKLDEATAIMTCDMTSKTVIGDNSETIRIDLLNQPYENYVKTHQPSTIKTTGINSKTGVLEVGDSECSVQDRYLICGRPFLERVNAGRENSVVIYLTPSNLDKKSLVVTTQPIEPTVKTITADNTSNTNSVSQTSSIQEKSIFEKLIDWLKGLFQ
jgi:hypothetical protein